MEIKNLEKYPIVRNFELDKEILIQFENDIVEHWEGGRIKGPVHLSNGNELQ